MRKAAIRALKCGDSPGRRISAPLLVAAALGLFPCSMTAAQERCTDTSVLEVPGVVQDRGVTTSGAADWKGTKADVSAMLERSRPVMDLILRPEEVAIERLCRLALAVAC